MKRFSRPLCLLLSLIIFSIFLVVPSSAAENLIDSNLKNWSRNDEQIYIDSIEDFYRLRIHSSSTIGDTSVISAAIYDLSSLTAGSSYNLQFYTLLPSELGQTDSRVYDQLKTGSLIIGLASYDPSAYSPKFEEGCYIAITSENYSKYFGYNTSFSFTMPNIENPCICIAYIDVGTRLSAVFGFKNFLLVDNEQAKEDGFFAKLFTWFQTRFDDLSSWFSNLGDRIYGFFVDLADSIEEGLNGLLDGIGGWFQKLGNLILYLTWSDEVPDNPFQSEDGPLDNVEGFFDGLIDYLRNIKTDLLNVIDSVTAGIHVFDLFTERFPWVKSLCLFAFALIIFSRFVGL